MLVLIDGERLFYSKGIPLELDLLQVYILCHTLFSSTFVNEELSLDMYISLVKMTISFVRELCFGLLCQWNLVHVLMYMRKEEFHHHFPVNPRQLTPIKMAVLGVKTNFL